MRPPAGEPHTRPPARRRRCAAPAGCRRPGPPRDRALSPPPPPTSSRRRRRRERCPGPDCVPRPAAARSRGAPRSPPGPRPRRPRREEGPRMNTPDTPDTTGTPGTPWFYFQRPAGEGDAARLTGPDHEASLANEINWGRTLATAPRLDRPRPVLDAP